MLKTTGWALVLVMSLAVSLVSAEVHAAESQATVYGFERGRRAVAFALPGGGGALIGGKQFISDRAAVSVDFGYSIAMPDKGDNTGGFTIVPAYLHYLWSGRMSPFVKAAMNITKKQGVEFGDALSLDLGAFFGTEYFLTQELSVAGELGLAINVRNDFEDITSQAGTGNIFILFYF